MTVVGVYIDIIFFLFFFVRIHKMVQAAGTSLMIKRTNDVDHDVLQRLKISGIIGLGIPILIEKNISQYPITCSHAHGWREGYDGRKKR